MVLFPKKTVCSTKNGETLLHMDLMGDGVSKTIKIMKQPCTDQNKELALCCNYLQVQDPIAVAFKVSKNASMTAEDLKAFYQKAFSEVQEDPQTEVCSFVGIDSSSKFMATHIVGIAYYRTGILALEATATSDIYLFTPAATYGAATLPAHLAYYSYFFPKPEALKQYMVTTLKKKRKNHSAQHMQYGIIGPVVVYRPYTNRSLGRYLIDQIISDAKGKSVEVLVCLSTSSFLSKALAQMGFTQLKTFSFAKDTNFPHTQLKPVDYIYPHNEVKVYGLSLL